MIRYPLAFAFLVLPSLQARGDFVEMEIFKDEASIFAGEQASKALHEAAQLHRSQVNKEEKDFVPKEEAKLSFSSEEIMGKLENKASPNNPLYDFLTSDEVQANQRNRHFDEDEEFLKNSGKIIEEPYAYIEEGVVKKSEEGVERFEILKCLKPGEAYPLKVTKSLQIRTEKAPESRARVCKGHHSESKRYKKREHAQDTLVSVQKSFREDKDIHSWNAYLSGHYHIVSDWRHKDNTESCDSFEERRQEGKREVFEEWVSDDPGVEKMLGSNCSRIEVICTDTEKTKEIDGIEIKKPCWKERHLFLCKNSQEDTCSVIKTQNCDLVGDRCVEKVPSNGHCKVWEKEFRCRTGLGKKNSRLSEENGIYALDGKAFDDSYEGSDSFAETITTLSIFDEIHKEIRESGKDADKISLFGGSVFRCKKSVFDHALYDCCTSLKGVAMSAGLRQNCSAEELTLGQRKEEGRCHHVGEFEEKVLGMKRATVNTFCCFPTKLARILHEQGRKQLKRGWGEAKSPNCSGFSYEEISQVDFSKIDLREVFEEKIRVLPNVEEKLNAFEMRLKDVQSNMEKAREKESRE